MFRSPTGRVLAALALGLALGALVKYLANPALTEAALVGKAVGGLWLNALKMTIVPLVFSLLVTGVAGMSDAAATGRLAFRAVVLFTLLILAGAVYSMAATSGLMALWPVNPESFATLKAALPTATPVGTVAGADIAQFLASISPGNPIKAAAEDAILPLVIFAGFLGFAITRLKPDSRAPLFSLFQAMGEAMVVIVHWVLLAAPIGVFGLSLGVGLEAGVAAATTIFHYVAVVILVQLGITLVPYVLIAVFKRRMLGRFIVAIAPVQALAVSTQSSLACLPAMLDQARGPLGVSKRVTDLILPLAVAIFRLTSPVANLAVVFFLINLYGIHPSLGQMAAAALVALAVAVGSVGLPGQVSFMASVGPICLALGVPVELLGIFLAVEVLPDIFRTIGNVTGDLGVTVLLARPEDVDASEPQEAALD
jgi:proton glutamate symport protein